MDLTAALSRPLDKTETKAYSILAVLMLLPTAALAYTTYTLTRAQSALAVAGTPSLYGSDVESAVFSPLWALVAAVPALIQYGRFVRLRLRSTVPA